MNYKEITARLLLLSVSIMLFVPGCISGRENVLSQVSTIDALLAGVYNGEFTLRELTEKGDTGIGTFNCLDGELLMLDGKVYQVKSDGKAYTPSPDITTPFAAVINFMPELSLKSDKKLSYPELQKELDYLAPKKNFFYAFKIKGRFKFMRTRSVPRQKKPFPALAEVVRNQPVFNMENIFGTIVGFRCPAYVKGINVPGYHLHFISEKRDKGGHVLAFEMDRGAFIEIDRCNKFFMVLPDSGSDFDKADLKIDRSKELHKVEH